MDNIYGCIDEFNLNKKRKILVVLDDMIADTLSNKKRSPIVTELFINSRKLKHCFCFITQSYFAVPKSITLNSKHYLLSKFWKNKMLQQIAINN